MTPETRDKAAATPESFFGPVAVLLEFGGRAEERLQWVHQEPTAEMNAGVGCPTDQELVAGSGIRVRKTVVEEEVDNGSQAGVQGLEPMDYVGTLGEVGHQPKTVTPEQ